jgi:hypothetical protein
MGNKRDRLICHPNSLDCSFQRVSSRIYHRATNLSRIRSFQDKPNSTISGVEQKDRRGDLSNQLYLTARLLYLSYYDTR